MQKKIIYAQNSVPGGMPEPQTYYSNYVTKGPVSTQVAVTPQESGELATPQKKTTSTTQHMVDPRNKHRWMDVTDVTTDYYDENGQLINSETSNYQHGHSNGVQVNIQGQDTAFAIYPDRFVTREMVGDNHFDQLKYAYEGKKNLSEDNIRLLQRIQSLIKAGHLGKDESLTKVSYLEKQMNRHGGTINYFDYFK